jgi:hypothetical protein
MDGLNTNTLETSLDTFQEAFQEFPDIYAIVALAVAWHHLWHLASISVDVVFCFRAIFIFKVNSPPSGNLQPPQQQRNAPTNVASLSFVPLDS